MRAYSWIAFAGVVLACGGGAFSSENDSGGEGGAGDDGNTGGVLGKAGNGGGGKIGSGGKVGTGGAIGVGGFGVAGDLVVGGSFPIAGEPGMAGGGPDPDPIDEVCPKDAPEAGNGCATGLTCSYGGDIRPDCRLRAKCQSGKWMRYEPTVDCSPLESCENGGVSTGALCSVQTDAPCLNGNLYCACVACTGGACADMPSWECVGPSNQQGCPNLVPNEGQQCSGEVECHYGSCNLNHNTLLATCNGTTWGWEMVECLPVP